MFNPKGKKLADVKAADVNKKAIAKLGKKYNATTGKKAPFFINLEHSFSDGSTGPLFVFGKLNAFKAEMKDTIAKNAVACVRGLCYVEYDDKKMPTLVFCPVKGKALKKETLVEKAMKKVFTPAYAKFKVGAEIDEKAAEAEEAAAEADEDIADDEVADEAPSTTAETTEKAAPKTKEEAQAAALGGIVAKIEGLLAQLKAANESGDAAAVAKLDAEVKAEFAKVAPKK